jgi:WD40 repeat protein/uncharacterized caspase-like protein
MKYILSLLFPLTSLVSIAQEVELVISSELLYSQVTSFSHEGRFLVNGAMKNVHIWDVKTGREIRKVQFTQNESHHIDSVWFSPDDKKVVVGLMFNNDEYHVDVETGKTDYIVSSVPYDYTIPYQKTRYQLANEHKASNSKEDLVYHTPDKKHQLRLRKVKNPFDVSGVMPYNFISVIKTGSKETVQQDTTFMTDVAFSEDSKYIYSNKKIYNAETHRLVSKLKVAPYAPMGVAFLPGTHVPVSAAQDNIRIWDFPNVRNIPLKGLGLVQFCPSYTHAIADLYNPRSKSKKHVRVDMTQEAVVNETNTPTKNISYITSVGPGAKSFCLTDQKSNNKDMYNISYTGIHMDVIENKVIAKYKNATRLMQTAYPDLFVVDSMGSNIHIHSTKTNFVRDYPGDSSGRFSYSYHLSNDLTMGLGWVSADPSEVADAGKVILVAWDIRSGQRKFSQKIEGLALMAYQVSKDQSLYACGNSTGSIFIFDFKNGKLLHEMKGHNAGVQELAFSDDSKRLISASMDGTRRVWNLESGEEMVSLISIGKEDFAIVTPDQYYYSTKGAHQNIHFVKGIEIFPFAQFDLKYNRPDIILERMMASNQEMVRPYYLAYKKRLKRLGFTEDMLDGEFHMPKVSIVNSATFPISTSSRQIKLNILSSDTKYKLDRVLVRVNGVPIHGKKGLSLLSKNIKSLGRTIEVELATGKNAISVSVLNEKGVESIADHFEIEYVAEKGQLPDLHLLAIGVSKYAESKFDLKYAAKDASDLTDLFAGEHAPFNKVHNYQLIDNAVVGDAVSTLGETLKSTKVDDVVCIFFAGHGLLDTDLNYFLASHDVRFDDPAKDGIPYESLEDLLDGIPARKKLMLIDACHSGEIDKEEVVLANNTETAHENVVFRAVGSSGLKQVGLHNSFELMKELFTDIRKSSGAMIISSAGGTEYAMEGDQWNNGVFTYCLLNGLKNGSADMNGDRKVMMSEINKYVSARVKELTSGKQQPTNRVEVIDLDFRLW